MQNDRGNMMSRASMTSNITLFSRDLLDTRDLVLGHKLKSEFSTPWNIGKSMTPGTEEQHETLGHTV